MTNFIEMTGKTEEEALSGALRQLGLDRDDVSVEIIERAKSGFLGLGSSPARIRVSYEAPDEVEEIVSAPAAPAAEETAAPVQEETAAAEVCEQEDAAEETPAEPAGEEEEVHDEKSEQIRTFLQGLMEHLDSNAVARVYLSEEGHYKVILEGEHLGQLIGRRGETLDAIQQLTNYSVNHGADRRIRIHVDAENYRAKREQTLEALAKKVAGKVIRLRRNVTLEPMNAYERHVIHSALQEYPGVSTASIGTEPNRRVVVHYERAQRSGNRSGYQK